MGRDDPRTDPRPLLQRVDSVPAVDVIAVVEDDLAARVGARSISFLIADYCGRAVVRIDGSTSPDTHVVALPGTVYERVLRTQQPDMHEIDGGVRLTVPVTVRGDAIGVLELDLPSYPDGRVLVDVTAVGHTLGYVVATGDRYTDLFERGQRTTPFTLAAEMQRRLLPNAFTYDAGGLAVAGWLEPASTVGGDTFDYALDRETLHVSITDAVGHDVNAAQLANVLVASLRNGRRRGMDLGEQARTANDALAAHSPPGEFVTGQVLRIDLRTGETVVVNAGHPFPLRLRRGHVDEVPLDIDIPFGLYPGREFRVQRLRLEPGDRLVLVTDGVLERNSEQVDLPDILRRTADLHPRELVREVCDAVLHASGGDLRDDATVLCLDWDGA